MKCAIGFLIFCLLVCNTKGAEVAPATPNTPAKNTNANENFVLNLVHVNDHHSHLEEDTLDIPLTNVKENARKISYGGFPRLVKLMRQAKNTWKNVLKIHAGDALVGTGFYHLFGTAPDVDMMQHVCFDAFNLGNHEFDDGDGVLAEFITKLTDINSPCQNTRVLSANLKPSKSSPLYPLQQQGYVAPYVIRRFPGGHKVGIIGINIRNRTLEGSQPDIGTTLTDERTVIRQQVRALERRGINKIVLVSHLGFKRDLRWAVKMEGVDVVIGAHSHTLLASPGVDSVVEKPFGNYPYVATHQANGKPMCITQAWKFGHGMGHLRVEFDMNGDVVMCGGKFLIPFETSKQADGNDAATITNYLEGLGPTFVKTPQELEALTTLQKYTDKMNGHQFFNTVLLKDAESLCNDAIPGEGRSSVCSKEDTAVHGGAACQLVAQAILNQTMEADVAIQNAGGCRADIAAGNFTYGLAMEFLPYSDRLVTLNMSGWQIHIVLEQAMEMSLGKSESSGSYPYASGLRFGVNASEETGYRISHLQLNSRLAEGTWNDIDLDANYTVVTNSFLATGHDGYLEFVNATGRQELTVTYLDAFISYVEDQGGIASPDPEAMSTQTFVGQPAIAETDDPDPATANEGSSNDELRSPLWMEVVDSASQDDKSIDINSTYNTVGETPGPFLQYEDEAVDDFISIYIDNSDSEPITNLRSLAFASNNRFVGVSIFVLSLVLGGLS